MDTENDIANEYIRDTNAYRIGKNPPPGHKGEYEAFGKYPELTGVALRVFSVFDVDHTTETFGASFRLDIKWFERNLQYRNDRNSEIVPSNPPRITFSNIAGDLESVVNATFIDDPIGQPYL